MAIINYEQGLHGGRIWPYGVEGINMLLTPKPYDLELYPGH